MQFIRTVRISGFRSIRKTAIEKLSELNVVFGRNDAGKSNVLRALNLFFNGQTNRGEALAIHRDLYRPPQSKKQLYVTVEFATPKHRQEVLGDVFTVRKMWSPNNPTHPEWLVSCPGKGKVKKGGEAYKKRLRAARTVLGEVAFHYVPAIKGREVFTDLLAQMYEVLTLDPAFKESLEIFESGIRKSTGRLTAELATNLGFHSQLTPPSDLEGLFRTLDFNTGKHGMSLLLQRGDGIKARHIPEILAFISDLQTSKYALWGFEEPENSLSYGAALEEVQTFQRYAERKNIQVIVTSHSPAFYNLRGEGVRRYFIHNGEEGSQAQPIKAGAKGASFMAESSLLASMADHLEEIQEERRRAERAVGEVKAELNHARESLADLQRPIVFVEGMSDIPIVEAAWRATFPGEVLPFKLHAAGGTTKMKVLAETTAANIQALAGARPVFGIVDNDHDGRDATRNKRHKKHPGQLARYENGTLWARLPMSAEYMKLMRELGVKDEGLWSYIVEDIFPPEVIREAKSCGTYRDVAPREFMTNKVWKRAVTMGAMEGDLRRFLFRPDDDLKVPFATWVGDNFKDPQYFGGLPGILRQIAEHC